MSSIYTRKVEYYETDKMGIVHHANYLHWFEELELLPLLKWVWNIKALKIWAL